MANVTATHREQVGPNRVRSTIHFTRTPMAADYAEAARRTAADLPSKDIVVYESEQVVIVERNLT